MITKAMPQNDIDALRERVTELENQLARQAQTVLALQENEARLQSVLNNLMDAPYRRNLRADCYDYLSPVFEQLTGWTVEEMNQANSQTVLARVHPDDLPQVQQEIERTNRLCGEVGRATGTLEYRFRTKAGDYCWLGDYLTVVAGDDGQPLYRVGVVRDITERKRIEMALQESEERFRLFMDNSPTTAWIKDDQGRYVYLSRTHERRFGVQLADWQGKTDFELWPPEVARQLWQNDQAVLAAGHLMEFTEETPPPHESYCIWWTFKFPFQNAAGQRYVAGIGLDITEREEIEAALYLTRFSVEHAADAIYWLDEAAQVVEVNETACRTLGYSRDELLQLSFYDITPGLSPEAWQEGWQRLQQLRSHTTERTHRTRDGQLIPVEVVANYIEFRGRSLNCAFVRDLSEHKRAEEARRKLEAQLHQAQKMESIGRLAGGVAHDFNNLLTVILGYSELMQAQLSLGSTALEQLVQVRLAAKRAEGLTRQLLAFSRKQMLAPEVFDLNELVTNLKKMLERLIGEDIVLITTLRPDLWWVKVDPGQIEQVIMNLAINARDAMPTGGRLAIETANISLNDHFDQTHPETLNGPSVRLTVTDTGHGMDEATLANIFEPFFTTKEQGKGTGLGLATVYGIIKQSGGEITVDSQPGQGTAFSLYLPAYNILSTGSPESLPEPVVQPGRETILLAEDERAVRDFVRMALRNYGYTLLEANHGYQALALAQQRTEPIDLLLTDVVMPDINGRELAERVKALHPRIKVLFMSGYTDDEVIRHGVQMAEVEFLPKPFSPVALAAKVRAILDK